MTEYRVFCEATQDSATIEAEDCETALKSYLQGYQTRNSDDEPVQAGKRYSTLTVWQGETVLMRRYVIADGRGGVLPQ